MCDYTPEMRILVAAMFLAAGALSGCAADPPAAPAPADDGAEVDELNTARLRAATAFETSVAPGGHVTVTYERGDPEYPRLVPYLAIELTSEVASAPKSAGIHPLGGETGMQAITVRGMFPGSPRITVVDENFNVLARSTTVEAQPDGSFSAATVAPRSAGKRFALVRDQRWSKPMSFTVGVGR